MKSLLSLFVPHEIERLYECAGLAPMYEGWLEGSLANLIVAIASYNLDDSRDGAGSITKALVEKAVDAGSIELGAKVFSDALEVPYEQVIGLIDGWAGKLDRDIDDPEESPQYIKETGFYRYRELGESLRNEMIIISLRRDVEQLGLTAQDVRQLAGVSARSDIEESIEGGVLYMLSELEWEPPYIDQRFRHESYRKNGGRLDFSDWRESGEPVNIDHEHA